MANHIFLLSFLLIATYNGVTNSTSILTQIPYPEILKSHIKTTPNVSMHDLLHVSLKETLVRAQNAHKLILDMDQNLLEDRAKTALTDCRYLYEDSIDHLNRSIASKNNHFDIQTWLSAAIANEQTCQNGFLDFGLPSLSSQHPSLDIANNDLSEYISNALAINKALSSSPDNFPQWVSTGDRRLLRSSRKKIRADIVVAQDGSSDYETISQGLAAAAATAGSGKGRVVIYVKKGIYKEIVMVEKAMKNIMMIGDGIDATIVTGSNNVQDGFPTFRSATFSAMGEGFIARDMTFENTAGAAKHQAVALLSTSDNSVFYKCSFKGYQDTLYVHSNRQFYRECDIYGTVDFIFGDAISVIQNCNIYLREPLPKQKNTITAQGKKNPRAQSGIIIHKSHITAAPGETPGENYLGRPWQLYSTTVFIKCAIDDIIAPEGWLEWKGDFALSTLYYGEYMNTGNGANTTGRVKWPGYHVISSADEAEAFSVGSFLAGKSWLPATGVPFTSNI